MIIPTLQKNKITEIIYLTQSNIKKTNIIKITHVHFYEYTTT